MSTDFRSYFEDSNKNPNACTYLDIKVIKRPIDLKDALAAGEPFIMRGFLDAITNFNVDYLFDHYEAHYSRILWREEHSKKYNQIINHYSEINIGEYINMIEQGETDLYLEQESIESTFPGLKQRLPIQELLGFGVLGVINCWVGPKGTKSTLHFDIDENFLIQAQGRKQVNLLSPEDTKYMHTKSVSYYDGFSEVDTYDVDYKRFPDFKNATVLHGTLFPGDVLHIPSRWWHDVRSLDVSVSYNIWWVYWSQLIKLVGKETLHRAKGLVGAAPPMEDKQSFYKTFLNGLKDKILFRR